MATGPLCEQGLHLGFLRSRPYSQSISDLPRPYLDDISGRAGEGQRHNVAGAPPLDPRTQLLLVAVRHRWQRHVHLHKRIQEGIAFLGHSQWPANPAVLTYVLTSEEKRLLDSTLLLEVSICCCSLPECVKCIAPLAVTASSSSSSSHVAS